MSVLVDYTSGAFAANKAQNVGTISGSDIDVSSGNYFAYTPTANTTFTFSNAPASGTAAGFALAVTGADVTTSYDLANASYDSVSLDISAKATFPAGLWFKPDGTKMYHTQATSTIAEVHEYDLSTAWDITSATFLQTFDAIAQIVSLQHVSFSPDGTQMYLVCLTNDILYQYSLSAAWDISTASYASKSLDASTQEGQLRNAFFKTDGTKVFLAGSSGDAVYEYDLSTPWDISTSTYVATFSVSPQETSPSSLFFNPDGTKMFLGGFGTDAIYQYSLSAAWDISTASYDSVSFSFASQDTAPLGVFFKPDGSKMYMSGSANDTIYQYSTGTSTPATLTYPASVDWPSGTAPDAPADGETDVLVFYTEDGGTTYYGFQAGDAMA